jgi:hypothetical protein
LTNKTKKPFSIEMEYAVAKLFCSEIEFLKELLEL